MTQRLSEDAMAYFDHFDECVSISTFDSSDLSAPEDPPHSSIGATSVSRSLFEPQGSMDSFSANKKVFSFSYTVGAKVHFYRCLKFSDESICLMNRNFFCIWIAFFLR